MSEPVDLHTLGVVVAALRRALEFEWVPLGAAPATYEAIDEAVAARQACRATLKWGEALCKGEAVEEPEA